MHFDIEYTLDLRWLKSIKSIEDYFYTVSENAKKYIMIHIYVNKFKFNREDLEFYYNCFESIAEELIEKMKNEKNNLYNYSIRIDLHIFRQEKFYDIKNLCSSALRVFYLGNWIDKISGHTYFINVNIEDGKINIYKNSYISFINQEFRPLLEKNNRKKKKIYYDKI